MENVIGLLILFAPLIFIYGAYRWHLLKEGKAFYFNKIKWGTKINRSRYLEIDMILKKRITFYRNLSDDGKAKFVNRLYHLLVVKKFIAKDELALTEEMKIVVCAAAVQLTFGLRTYDLDNVKGFYMYPDVFYNRFLKGYLKGSTPQEGLISLSWKHLEHGFLIDDDKYNLGLHELAHALKLSTKFAYNFDSRYASYVERWEQFGHVEFLKMKRGNDSFLRKYGGVNEHEFFAVCVEHFFEVPEKFQYNLPKIFYHLTILLNIDPLNISGDYRLIKR